MVNNRHDHWKERTVEDCSDSCSCYWKYNGLDRGAMHPTQYFAADKKVNYYNDKLLSDLSSNQTINK